MSFVEEQRNQILENGNTAQSDFLDILEHLSPTESTIDVRVPLSGSLDLSVLSKCNFTGITALVFVAGDITSIQGIPEGVTKIICAENLLEDIPELPASLIELDLHKNAIREVPEGRLPQGLKTLNLSDNQIHTLADLPKDLEVLKCENNRMKVLKLAGIIALRICLCGSNPLLVIENVPDTLEEFDSDTDIVVQIKQKDNGDDEEAEITANYNEALLRFFQMKNEYETRVFKAKRDIFKAAKTKKEAKMKIGLLKPKCSYCDRPVGSIFKTEGRKYIARCGDTDHPCAFHIELFGGEYGKVMDMMESYQRTIEFTKQAIIKDKLDVLYRYISEEDGVEFFKDNLDYYTKQGVHLASLKKEYEDLYFNEETEEKVLTKRKKIAEIQDKLSELIQEYRGTENLEVLKDAIAIYDRELVPEINNMGLIQWQTREITENEETGMFELYQRPFRIGQLEYTFGEYPRIVHYKVRD